MGSYPDLDLEGGGRAVALPYFGVDQVQDPHAIGFSAFDHGHLRRSAKNHGSLANSDGEDGDPGIDDQFDESDYEHATDAETDDENGGDDTDASNSDALDYHHSPRQGQHHATPTAGSGRTQEQPIQGRGRGRGRGRARGRPRGFGLGRGSMGGVVKSSGRPPGRPKRTSEDKIVRKPKGPVNRAVQPDAYFQATYTEAMTAFLDSDLDLARERTEECIQSNPEILSAYNLLSQIHGALGNEKESMETLWLGACLSKDADVWWELLRHTRQTTGYTEEQRRHKVNQCLSGVIRIDDKNYEARRQRLEVYLQEPLNQNPAREFRAILRRWPLDLEILGNYAEHALSRTIREELHKARSTYRIAIERFKRQEPNGGDSEFDFPDLNLYLSLLRRLEAYEEGLNVAKDVSRWLLGRKGDPCWANFTDDDREWDESHEERRMLFGEFTRDEYPLKAYGAGLDIETRVRMGLFRLELGKQHFGEAMRHFWLLRLQDRSEDAPVYKSPDLFAEVADTLFSHGRWLSAVEFYESLISTNAGIPNARRARIARTYKELGRFDAAIESYETFLEADSRHEDMLTEVAVLCQRAGYKKKAQEFISRVLSLHKDTETDTIVSDGDRSRSVEQVAHGHVEVETGRSSQQAVEDNSPVTDPRDVSSTTPAVQDNPKEESAQAKPPSVGPPEGRRRGIHIYTRTPRLQLPASLLHLQMQFLQPQMRKGDEPATLEWLDHAETLLNHIANVPYLLPKDDGKQTQHIDEDGVIDLNTPPPQTPGSDSRSASTSVKEVSLHDTQKDEDGRTHEGLSMRDWLDLFCDYALLSAKRGEQEHSYSALQTCESIAPIASTDTYNYHIHVVWLVCALQFNDDDQLTTTARWFTKAMPFESNTYRLYNAVHLLCDTHKLKAHNDLAHIKFFRRQIRLMDFALLSPTERSKARFSSEERAAALGPHKLARSHHPGATEGNPYGIKAPNVELLLLFGNLLAANSSHQEALTHYLRAFQVDPRNALTALFIAISSMQYALEKSCDDRNGCLTTATAFLQVYKELRLRERDSEGMALPAQRIRNRRQEVAYNEGRFYHGLGQIGLAIEAYERCLGVKDEPLPEQKSHWLMLDEDGDLAMKEEEDQPEDGEGCKELAAFALQQAYAVGGDLERAREVTGRWLVF